MHTVQELEAMAHRVRERALEMGIAAGRAGKGVHFGSGLSAAEILTVLYQDVLKYDVDDMSSPDRDRFFIGKTHCILGQFPAMLEAGIITEEQMMAFREDGNPLLGYPKDLTLGFEYNGGSLGTAFSYAVGVAFALKRRGRPNHVYVLIGDGECDEGVVWESIMSASHLGLDNVTLIVDRNQIQLEGKTEEILAVGDLRKKLEDFGWSTLEVDGHSIKELQDAFATPTVGGMPRAIVAHTIKGKGISFMENNPIWHQRRLSEKEYEVAVAELQGAEL